MILNFNQFYETFVRSASITDWRAMNRGKSKILRTCIPFWNFEINVRMLDLPKKKLIIELLIKDLKKKPTAAIMSYIPMLWYLFI